MILLSWCYRQEVREISKLELVAEIGSGQVEIVQIYLKGLLSADELEHLIGKQKTSMVNDFTTEYVKAWHLAVQMTVGCLFYWRRWPVRGACRLSFNRKVLLLNKNRSEEDRSSKEGLFTKLVTFAKWSNACGDRELSRRSDPPQAENLSSGVLSSDFLKKDIDRFNCIWYCNSINCNLKKYRWKKMDMIFSEKSILKGRW